MGRRFNEGDLVKLVKLSKVSPNTTSSWGGRSKWFPSQVLACKGKIGTVIGYDYYSPRYPYIIEIDKVKIRAKAGDLELLCRDLT